MKRIITLFLVTFVVFSCKSDDDVIYVETPHSDYDTYPVVYDLVNVNFDFVNGSYTIHRTFNTPMYESDVLLVYIQNGSTTNGAPIWQQIPVTYYLPDGHEVDYNFDFSMYDVAIYAGGTFNLGGTQYVNNRTFRLVFVPGSFGKEVGNQVDYSDYESVIEYFDIDDTNVGAL